VLPPPPPGIAALVGFSPRANQVVALAQEEARLLKHGYVGTEHLLLGLVDEGTGPSGDALAAAGISRDVVWRAVSGLVQPGAHGIGGNVPLTPRARRAINRSIELASAYGVVTEPEHLLPSILCEPDAVATRALLTIGVDTRALVADLPAWPTDPSVVTPECPHCRLPLDNRLGLIDLRSGARDVVVAFCTSCLTAISTEVR
jgi:ATP-dependent Clp protease ATP-binding subunit ClpA